MIKRLRRRFVLIAAVSVLVVELLVVGLINVTNIGEINGREKQLMKILCDNEGEFPEFGKPRDQKPDMAGEFPPRDENMGRFGELGFRVNEETRYQTRYFYVLCDDNSVPVVINTVHIAAVTSEKAVGYEEEAFRSGKDSGFIDNYRFAVKETQNGRLYIFLDCRDDIQTKQTFMLISAAISLGSWILVCLLMIVCSKYAVKPFVENYEKQRMFVTDAGHEIKTPLAIIQANTEVIEMISGESEWTESIKNQIGRLNGLIADLLKLSRMDEVSTTPVFAEFDLSEAFIDIAQPFKTPAENKGLSFEVDAQEEIRMNGDEASIRQLVSVLTENAVKYCDKDGKINVSLSKTGSGRHAIIKCENDCAEPPEEPDRLFDRFYRADSSRSRSDGESKGGYGIGLSVAKATVEAHKGRISCKTEGNKIIFTVRLRCL